MVESIKLTLEIAAHFPEHFAAMVKDHVEIGKSRGAKLHFFERGEA
jgi:hypothetical protein